MCAASESVEIFTHAALFRHSRSEILNHAPLPNTLHATHTHSEHSRVHFSNTQARYARTAKQERSEQKFSNNTHQSIATCTVPSHSFSLSSPSVSLSLSEAQHLNGSLQQCFLSRFSSNAVYACVFGSCICACVYGIFADICLFLSVGGACM